MGRWPARPNTSAMRLSRGLHALNGLNGCDEVDTTIARPRLLDLAEIPADTARLAHFLIGKMLVRVLAEGMAGGPLREAQAYGLGGPPGAGSRGHPPPQPRPF